MAKRIKDCTIEELRINCGTITGCGKAEHLQKKIEEMKAIIKQKCGMEPDLQAEAKDFVLIGCSDGEFDTKKFGRITLLYKIKEWQL